MVWIEKLLDRIEKRKKKKRTVSTELTHLSARGLRTGYDSGTQIASIEVIQESASNSANPVQVSSIEFSSLKNAFNKQRTDINWLKNQNSQITTELSSLKSVVSKQNEDIKRLIRRLKPSKPIQPGIEIDSEDEL